MSRAMSRPRQRGARSAERVRHSASRSTPSPAAISVARSSAGSVRAGHATHRPDRAVEVAANRRRCAAASTRRGVGRRRAAANRAARAISSADLVGEHADATDDSRHARQHVHGAARRVQHPRTAGEDHARRTPRRASAANSRVLGAREPAELDLSRSRGIRGTPQSAAPPRPDPPPRRSPSRRARRRRRTRATRSTSSRPLTPLSAIATIDAGTRPSSRSEVVGSIASVSRFRLLMPIDGRRRRPARVGARPRRAPRRAARAGVVARHPTIRRRARPARARGR